MQIRELTEEDVGIMAEWWEIRESHLPLDVLPPKGFGIWDGDEFACGSFLYEMEGKSGPIGMIGWLCTKPDLGTKALLAISALLKGVKLYCRSKGFSGVIGTTNSPVLQHQYIRCDFVEADTDINQYIHIF